LKKRIFDCGIALLALPPASLLCVLCAIPVWIEGRANPFFLQSRLGRRERPFNLLKIRTMSAGTVQGASHEIGTSTVLRVGRLIRRLKIDELPQLWNVLTGDMSLVGPRPGLPVQRELTEARRAHGVFELRPGITGVSQVAGLDMSTPLKLAESDARYLGPWSAGCDLLILWRTVSGSGRGDAAVEVGGRDVG
jgi:O-antigen biosynthesis protein WbqP